MRRGQRVGEHRGARLMRQAGIRAKTVKKWRPPTQSQHRFPVAANTLDRGFTVAAPNRIWAGDITYVWTLEGWLYLAVLLDLYSRRVVGWAMGSRLTVDLAEQALRMALAKRVPKAGLLHHSDRGSQYAATSYQRLLEVHGLHPSMSRKGNCWDNACVESFFGTLKRELVYHRHYATRDEAMQDIFTFIILQLTVSNGGGIWRFCGRQLRRKLGRSLRRHDGATVYYWPCGIAGSEFRRSEVNHTVLRAVPRSTQPQAAQCFRLAANYRSDEQPDALDEQLKQLDKDQGSD